MAEIKASVPGVPAESAAERRRTQRVMIAMPVLCAGKRPPRPSRENEDRLSERDGCLVRLGSLRCARQEIGHREPQDRGRIAFDGNFYRLEGGSKAEVGVEFAEPSPLFWRIAFPPPDWDSAEPSAQTGLWTPTKLPK